jgi:superfamily I DNA/RNA helicase
MSKEVTDMPNLLITAGPGCGKSYTIEKAYFYSQLADLKHFFFDMTEEQKTIFDWCREHLPKSKSVLYLAHQKVIADRLKERLPKFIEAHTFNAFGHRLLMRTGKTYFDKNLVPKLVSKIARDWNLMTWKERIHWNKVNRFTEKFKQEDLLPNRDSLDFICSKYPVEEPPSLDDILLLWEEQRKHRGGIAYIDQLYKGAYTLREPLYDIAFVDEFQDMSQIMLRMATRAAKNTIFCGDPNQCITRFAGAGEDIYTQLKGIVDKELPLKTVFRCPPNVIRLANRTIPSANLRPSPEKKDGEFKTLTFDQFLQTVKADHMVLARKNATLVSVCLRLILAGIPAKIVKTDIYKNMENFLNRLKVPFGPSMDKLLIEYKGSEVGRMMLNDQVETVETIGSHLSKAAILSKLKEMLSDDGEEGYVNLSTIHKAKGLEWENVHIITPIRHELARTPEDIQQEINLEFVAYTRTQSNLYLVQPC